MSDKPRSHWWLLTVLALAQFMVVLDVSIVNVALPTIQKAFHMPQSSLQWIVTMYTLAFGGFLLLGGRAADLYGRRRLFMTGTILFGLISLLDGLSQSGGMLIALRGAQGLMAALMSPAALSIVLVTYREGHERNTALSVWGAVASGGAAAGVLLGGIITQYLGWRWNFFINVPVSLAVALATWRLVPAHESEETHNQLDLPGAVSVTAALMLLVYGLVEAPSHGWTAHSTLGYFLAAAALLTYFVMNEQRVKHPLVPFRIFRIRNVTAANITQMPIIAGMFSTFFFVTLYAQRVLGYSPVRTGLSFLVIPVFIAISATNVPRLVKKIGFKPILMVAPLFTASALFWFSRVRVHGNFTHDLLPGFILMGIGMGATFIAMTIAATTGVPHRESGLASGLLNTSQQMGGAIGLAVLTGISTSAAVSYITNLHLHSAPATSAQLAAMVHGFHEAFLVASCFMLGAAVLATVLIKQQKVSDSDVKAAMTSGG
ncbi:MAG TPA: MFS transporter [Candidatus Saccharimonadales bacterium]|nr:MFS transporter [Candidatus Saccharimonadales bacterium]